MFSYFDQHAKFQSCAIIGNCASRKTQYAKALLRRHNIALETVFVMTSNKKNRFQWKKSTKMDATIENLFLIQSILKDKNDSSVTLIIDGNSNEELMFSNELAQLLLDFNQIKINVVFILQSLNCIPSYLDVFFSQQIFILSRPNASEFSFYASLCNVSTKSIKKIYKDCVLKRHPLTILAIKDGTCFYDDFIPQNTKSVISDDGDLQREHAFIPESNLATMIVGKTESGKTSLIKNLLKLDKNRSEILYLIVTGRNSDWDGLTDFQFVCSPTRDFLNHSFFFQKIEKKTIIFDIDGVQLFQPKEWLAFLKDCKEKEISILVSAQNILPASTFTMFDKIYFTSRSKLNASMPKVPNFLMKHEFVSFDPINKKMKICKLPSNHSLHKELFLNKFDLDEILWTQNEEEEENSKKLLQTVIFYALFVANELLLHTELLERQNKATQLLIIDNNFNSIFNEDKKNQDDDELLETQQENKNELLYAELLEPQKENTNELLYAELLETQQENKNELLYTELLKPQQDELLYTELLKPQQELYTELLKPQQENKNELLYTELLKPQQQENTNELLYTELLETQQENKNELLYTEFSCMFNENKQNNCSQNQIIEENQIKIAEPTTKSNQSAENESLSTEKEKSTSSYWFPLSLFF